MYLYWVYKCLKTLVMGNSCEVSVLPITTTGIQQQNPNKDELMGVKITVVYMADKAYL